MRKPIYILLLFLSPVYAFSPSRVEACTYENIALKEKKYVWITNLQGLGMIKVAGKVIHLHRTQERSSNNPGEVYEGGGYVIVVKLKEGKQIADEDTYEKGTIEVRYGNTRATYAIHGHADC